MNESEDIESTAHLSETSSKRSLIDQEVYSWVVNEQMKGKICTGNMVRQKAYEIGRNYDPYFKASLNWYTKWKKRYDYEESPEANALKNRKRSYTAAFKLYAVQRASELLSVSQASLELNVSRRCLQRWREEIDVINSVAKKAANAVYRRPGQGRKVADSSLDAKLVEWLDKAWKNGEQVTTNAVRQKAKELSSNPEFKASLGWYVKWQRRHKINLKDRTMSSPVLKSPEDAGKSPLKLRLLPDGQDTMYTNKPKSLRKRPKRDYTEEEVSQQESSDEFDRLLLTWLVEQWEVGETINEKMLRDKASELTTNPDFRATRAWMSNWKEKYNVSLDSQTYGTAGEAEGEIVEESQVYDELTLHDSANLTSKEEAATALASLAAEGPNGLDGGTGLEIAVALQKIATAIGLQASTADALQQLSVSMEQPTSLLGAPKATCPSECNALTSLDTPTTPYLVVGGEVQVGAEEVVSEEVITDDQLVVVETGEVVSSSDNIVTVQSSDSNHMISVDSSPLESPIPSISNISSLSGLQADSMPSISSATFSTSSLSQLIETLSNAPPISNTLYQPTVVYTTTDAASLVEPICSTVPIETEVVIAEDSNPPDPSVLLQSEVVDWEKVAGLFGGESDGKN